MDEKMKTLITCQILYKSKIHTPQCIKHKMHETPNIILVKQIPQVLSLNQ